MFITYEDVLKLFPVKIKCLLEEYGLDEVVNEDQAIAMLRLTKWNGEKMSERWFADENKFKQQVGIKFDPGVMSKMSA